jgi:hypothetical protein
VEGREGKDNGGEAREYLLYGKQGKEGGEMIMMSREEGGRRLREKEGVGGG